MNRRAIGAVAWCALLLSPVVRAETYRGSELYAVDGPPHDAGDGQVVGRRQSQGGPIRATLWDRPNGQNTGLHPAPSAEIEDSAALGVASGQQVGWVYKSIDIFSGKKHAYVWNGTAASGIDLHPANVTDVDYSEAWGTNGIQQVGFVAKSSVYPTARAALWNGSPESYVNLHPSFLSATDFSVAYDTDGEYQVGASSGHALLWHGSADTAVDLNPTSLPGVLSSKAWGVSGNQQVGTGGSHAMLWTGTPESAVDLHPTNLQNYVYSEALDTNGVNQVGWGSGGIPTGGWEHAMMWSSSADSAVDLHLLLSSRFRSSRATSIDDDGNVYGVAFDMEGYCTAVMWTPVPEPGMAMLAICGVMCLYIRGRARRR